MEPNAARCAGALTLVLVCLSGCAHERVTPVASQPGTPRQPLADRAMPFARYITAMHRQIHPRFTHGFLSDIDARKDPAYADQTLWTQLEIVVNGDGTIAKLDVVRPSSLQAFDDAVLASVRFAAPFPPPPQLIESVDGRVHLGWQFHRDERACGTFGADPHMLGSDGQTEHKP
jgi:TonB family protein